MTKNETDEPTVSKFPEYFLSSLRLPVYDNLCNTYDSTICQKGEINYSARTTSTLATAQGILHVTKT